MQSIYPRSAVKSYHECLLPLSLKLTFSAVTLAFHAITMIKIYMFTQKKKILTNISKAANELKSEQLSQKMGSSRKIKSCQIYRSEFTLFKPKLSHQIPSIDSSLLSI